MRNHDSGSGRVARTPGDATEDRDCDIRTEETLGIIRLIPADLDSPPISLAELEAALTAPERSRAERIRHPEVRRRRVAARGLLRHLLARETGLAPADVPLETTPLGKPFLTGGPSFNLSHSGRRLLIALAPDGRLGVDVEQVRPMAELEGLARRIFLREEARAILNLPDEPPRTLRTRAFFRTWVCKEAFVKGVGAGVRTGLDTFEVRTGPVATPAGGDVGRDQSGEGGTDATEWARSDVLLRIHLPEEADRPWRIVPVPSPPGVEAALAWDRPEHIPEMVRWTG